MADALYAALERIGFTDPLHALLVHMPIGLITGAFLFFLVALLFGRLKLVPSARHAAILAFIFVFPTILTGVLDWLHFYRGAMIPAIRMKMILAGAVTVVIAAAIVVGGSVRLRTVWMTVLYALAFVAVVGLGYFGGGLVYGRGEKAQTKLTAEAKAGKAVFETNCAGCHAGGGNVVDTSRPLKGSKKLADRESFVAFIRQPLLPDGSEGSMPPFDADTVSDSEAADLFAYVTAMRDDPSWK
jgi:mono/diheme cytochrome c family protein